MRRLYHWAAGVVFWTSAVAAAIAIVLLCTALLEDFVEMIKEMAR